jgi:hypothetical protein
VLSSIWIAVLLNCTTAFLFVGFVMVISSMTVSIRLAWWFKWYMRAIIAMSRLTGLPPNEERVLYWAMKAISVHGP